MDQELLQQTKDFLNGHPVEDYQLFYAQLHHLITKSNQAYYELSEPIMDDQTYDIFLEAINKLKEHRKEYYISVATDEYLWDREWEVEHKAPMLSQQKIKDEKGIQNFIKQVKEFISEPLFVVEPKFDGLSIELVYENWTLIDAVTRGNGHIGESVMRSVQYIPSIPKTINLGGLLSLRWEIILPIQKFISLGKTSSNPRNLASGILRTLSPNQEECKLLECYCYEILANTSERRALRKQIEVHALLKELGFLTHPFCEVKTSEELASFLINEEQAEWLQNQDLEMDGYVVKVNDLQVQKEMGLTGHHPKSSFAFKYQGEQTTTKIIWVTWQVGKSGILTPVAELTPVKLGGVTIKRATLHNMDFIIAKGLHINNYVYLQRSGDVIPYIVGIDTNQPSKDLQPITVPILCPTCKEKVIDNVCCNGRCPSKMIGKMLQVVGKNAFNIDGFGNELISLLVEKVYFDSPCQILDINKYQETLEETEGFGHKKIYNLQKELKRMIEQPQALENILVAFNFPMLNKGVAKLLVNAMNPFPQDFNELMLWLNNKENYRNIHWIWEVLTNEIYKKASNVEFCSDKLALEDLGIKIAKPIKNEKAFHFSITWTFSKGRNEIIQELEQKGAIYHSSPSKQCNVVFVGADAGGSKLDKAQKLNITLAYGDESIQEYLSTLL